MDGRGKKVSESLIEKVRSTIKSEQLIKEGSTVFAAVSGGADSVCLLHILSHLREEGNFQVKVCHFDHMLRGQASDGDRLFTEKLAEDLGFEFFFERQDVALYAEEAKLSIEEAARLLRYDFLRRCSKGEGVIALAHHMEDQFETVFLNLMRGSGTAGLAGMKYKSKDLIRPLLDCRREEIEAFLEQNKFAYRVDASNLEDDYDRNALRLNIVPLISKYFQRDIVASLNRTAGLVHQDNEFLESLASELFVQKRQDEGLPRKIFEDLHFALASRLIRLEYEAARGEKTDFEYKHLILALNFVKDPAKRGRLDMPGKITLLADKNLFWMEKKPDF